jgi:hypothetical protein
MAFGSSEKESRGAAVEEENKEMKTRNSRARPLRVLGLRVVLLAPDGLLLLRWRDLRLVPYWIFEA